MNDNEISTVRELIRKKPATVILTHFNPDGDAIGSALGLYHYLKSAGCKTIPIVPDPFPAYLKWMPESEAVLIARQKPEEALNRIHDAELIFCVDFNSLNRLMGMEQAVRLSKAPKILIDHHEKPENFSDYMWSEPGACSAAELVFKFLQKQDNDKFITTHVLNCLYTGILTDSMGFSIGNATAQTHRIVAELIDMGASYREIHTHIYNTNSLDRLRFIGFCLTEKLQVLRGYSTAIISLSADDLKRFNHQVGDAEGVVNYALSVDGVKLAAFIVERDSHIKLSFRSKGDFPVHDLAKKHFNGGGHFHAAGGETKLGLKETTEKLIQLLPQYKMKLNESGKL